MNKTLWKNRMTSTHELVQSLIPLEPPRNLIPGLGWFKIHQAMNLTTSQPSSWNEVRGHGRCCLHKACTLGSLTESLLTDGDKLQAPVGWWNPIFWYSFLGKEFRWFIFLYSRNICTKCSQILWYWFTTCRWRYKTMGTSAWRLWKPLESLPLGGFNRIQNSVDPDLFIPAWEWKSCTHAYQYISNISHGKNNETSSTPSS